ncbi:beta-lactamase domain-containing protein [Penicillium malachiteum]|uniref:beta-lactamase domain-containing protein n=1 Tax=Penicillium malachiteum TaxID=1324776 RepID=UPI002547FDC0|nr:beta-lactamase domain-containing protein [Penicillium malachiteum]KAJ5715699.1 beta-lactamase domain-containing protein [Penicillium malachiteum]
MFNLGDTTQEVIWDTNAYDFLQDDVSGTANPSLWRQGQLCSVTAGLYQVTDGVYQVRGFGLANMSIVEIPKSNGIIIIDCLTSVETTRSALQLYLDDYKERTDQDAEVRPFSILTVTRIISVGSPMAFTFPQTTPPSRGQRELYYLAREYASHSRAGQAGRRRNPAVSIRLCSPDWNR